MATPNEIAGGYTKTVVCRRCQGDRWVRVDTLEPYTCQRCRMVLAGRPTVDPLSTLTPEQRQILSDRAKRSFQRRRSHEPEP